MAIGQTGQRIEIGLLPDQFIGSFFQGDVREQRYPSMYRAIIVIDGIYLAPFNVDFPVLARPVISPSQWPVVSSEVCIAWKKNSS